jgi:hypothetical protein
MKDPIIRPFDARLTEESKKKVGCGFSGAFLIVFRIHVVILTFNLYVGRRQALVKLWRARQKNVASHRDI